MSKTKLLNCLYATTLMIVISGLTLLILYALERLSWIEPVNWNANFIALGIVIGISIICQLFSEESSSGGGHNCTGNYNCICGGGGCD